LSADNTVDFEEMIVVVVEAIVVEEDCDDKNVSFLIFGGWLPIYLHQTCQKLIEENTRYMKLRGIGGILLFC
jgi:hypothetical protein